MKYSSVPSEEATRSGKPQTTPTRRKEPTSPRKTIETASTSISSAVATSVNSARKMKDRATHTARSLVPKKLLAAQCTYTPVAGNRHKARDIDETTPVIFYRDECAKRVAPDAIAFVDPFAFEGSGSPGNEEDDEFDSSPTSVVPVRLFPDESLDASVRILGGESNAETATPTAADNRVEKRVTFDEVVLFDCPIFTQDFVESEEDTSIEFSEAIKSINALSVKDEARSILESIRDKKRGSDGSSDPWQDHSIAWDGFKKSSTFNTLKFDDAAAETK